jgi:hypothetical protein
VYTSVKLANSVAESLLILGLEGSRDESFTLWVFNAAIQRKDRGVRQELEFPGARRKGNVSQGEGRRTWDKGTGVRHAFERSVTKDHADLGRR